MLTLGLWVWWGWWLRWVRWQWGGLCASLMTISTVHHLTSTSQHHQHSNDGKLNLNIYEENDNSDVDNGDCNLCNPSSSSSFYWQFEWQFYLGISLAFFHLFQNYIQLILSFKQWSYKGSIALFMRWWWWIKIFDIIIWIQTMENATVVSRYPHLQSASLIITDIIPPGWLMSSRNLLEDHDVLMKIS